MIADYECGTREQNLCSGIFWVICESGDLADHMLLHFAIPCDKDGNPVDELVIPLNSKSGNSYNHKKLWESEVKNNPAHKPYNRRAYSYYPRGRVEIANNRAVIYLNPNTNTPDIIAEIHSAFGLSGRGLKTIRVIVDNSAHYKCHDSHDSFE